MPLREPVLAFWMTKMNETPNPIAAPGNFLTVMKGNHIGVWTTIGAAVLIFVVWRTTVEVIALSFPFVASMFGGEVPMPAHQEALAMGLFLLGGFGPAFLLLMRWRRAVEERETSTLFTSAAKFRWSLLWMSALVVGLLGLAITLPFDLESTQQISDRIARFTVTDWLLLAAVYGIGIFVQASFEEVFIRGWLLQHLCRFVPSALVAILVSSVIFSALHIGHPGWATLATTFAIGLVFGWSALRLNGLEAAMGAHIANNLIGALLAGQMLMGNAPTMDAADMALYAAYILGFLLFVELWARFGEKSARG
jgi:uncharacterized protein